MSQWLAVAVDYSVKRQGDGAEHILFHLLLLFIYLAFAVGVKPDENELLSPPRRPSRKDVRFHPSAVGAGVAGKIDKDAFVFGLCLASAAG